MLLRLDAIHEIGRFSSLKQKAGQFPRLTLIFARNGYGKSTLCSILRSAASANPLQIAARRKLGAVADSIVQSKWKACGAVDFNNGKWNKSPSSVYIFDQEYVQQNVHVAENVTRDNKRNLLNTVLGEKGVELARLVMTLDAEQKELTRKHAASGTTIKAFCPIVSDVDAYCCAPVPEDIEHQILAATRALELARHTVAIKQKRNPTSFNFKPAAEIEAIIQRTIADVSNQAALLVKSHLDEHSMHPNGERWLKYGVDHMNGTACPFCTQDIAKIDLVHIFKTYFGQEYAALASDRDVTITEIKNLYGDDGALFTKTLNENDADFEFWKGVCQFALMPALTAEQRKIVTDGLTLVLGLLEKKLANPLCAISFGDDKVQIETAFSLLTEYNNHVYESLKNIDQARSEAATADVSKADIALKQKNALKAKLSGALKAEVTAFETQSARLKKIIKEKKLAQDALTAYVKKAVPDRQSSINDLLESFGANIVLSDTKAGFIGRDPNAEFSILIGAHSIKAGESMDTEPSFKTVLSAGDKFTLALAFFLTQVKASPNICDATIILDDPFSSQDMQRQWETTSQIRALSKQACQVIVLSHDPRFLHQIEKDAFKEECATFQISCDDQGNGAISAWSASDELKSVYVRQSEVIREYATQGNFLKGITADSLIQMLRPFSEDYIRCRFPGRFNELQMLDEMIKSIEEAGISDPLFKDVAELRAINEYTRPNMHGGAISPDPIALRAQCRRVVKIVGAY